MQQQFGQLVDFCVQSVQTVRIETVITHMKNGQQ
jgi:hypothetical protein